MWTAGKQSHSTNPESLELPCALPDSLAQTLLPPNLARAEEDEEEEDEEEVEGEGEGGRATVEEGICVGLSSEEHVADLEQVEVESIQATYT